MVGFVEAVVHLVVTGEDAGIDVTERDDHRSGQSGCVHDVSATQLTGVAQSIGKHQATFGVRINNLDRFAGHRDLHVARFLRLAGGHIFSRANDRSDLYFWLEQR